MAEQQIDLNDAFVSPLFILMMAADSALIDFELLGFDFASPILSSGFAEVSTASIISVLCILVVIATNKPDIRGLGFIQFWVALVTIGLVVAPPFVPALDWLLGHAIPAAFSVIIATAGFYILAYLG